VPEQHPDRRRLAEFICGRFDAADKGIHSKLRERWDAFDRDYHNYRDATDALQTASPRDADRVMNDVKHAFGHQLFIPMTFATVESTAAQLMANPPHPVVLPSRYSTTVESAGNMGYLIAQEQEQADVELEFQMASKEALRLGLGVVKSRWQRTMMDVPMVQESVKGDGSYALQEVSTEIFDGPLAERIDPRDFLWDAMGYNMKTIRCCFHRTWRDTGYVLAKFQTGAWKVTVPSGEQIALMASEVRETGAAEKYTTVFQGGFHAQGFDGALDSSKLGDLHEVWEYHDGSRIVTVLDRTYVVADFANPTPRTRMPFHIFRPTDIGYFHGKGVIEPIRDLQLELNDLRTDRRWNALMALHQFFFYDDNAMDGDDVSIFPGAMIPTRGNPNEMIKQGLVKDIPNSSVTEEEALKGDIYMTAGQQDPTMQTAAPETATGVQLVQAATQYRMNLMIRRAELELAVPVGRHWIQLNQREILAAKDVRKPVQAPDPQQPDRLYELVQLSPGDLAGEFDYTIVGNSMAANNIAQQRQDAQTLQALLQNPLFAAEPLAQEIMRKLGYPNPQAYLAPQAPPLPATLAGKLKDMLGAERANALIAAASREEKNQNGR
jgi:hypothetical protein